VATSRRTLTQRGLMLLPGNKDFVHDVKDNLVQHCLPAWLFNNQRATYSNSDKNYILVGQMSQFSALSRELLAGLNTSPWRCGARLRHVSARLCRHCERSVNNNVNTQIIPVQTAAILNAVT
jgi:hypothetical protein